MSKPQDNPVAAILIALLTAILMASMNLFAKLLGETFSAIEITLFRNIVAFMVIVIGLILLGRLSRIKTTRPAAHIIRATIGTVSLFFTIWSYTVLPLADATALLFTQPLWVVILSYPLLREKVGIYRIIAVVIGFLGVFVMAGPTGDIGTKGLLIGLTAGFLNGCVAICLRWLGQSEHAETTVFYFVGLGLLGTGFFLPLTGTNIPQTDLVPYLPYILGLGLFGLGSLLTKTYSYRLGDAALVTIINYTMIIWAGLFDYLIWSKLPTLEIILGASIIIASNLFILWREHSKKRELSGSFHAG